MGKGSRRERECAALFQRAGFATYRPATVRFGENDVWGLFDVLAISVHGRLWAVQVKSNRASGIRAWTRHTRLWRRHGFVTAYAIPVDGEGWRLVECTDDGTHDLVDERDADVNMGEGVVAYLEDVERSVRDATLPPAMQSDGGSDR